MTSNYTRLTFKWKTKAHFCHAMNIVPNATSVFSTAAALNWGVSSRMQPEQAVGCLEVRVVERLTDHLPMGSQEIVCSLQYTFTQNLFTKGKCEASTAQCT